MRGAQFGSAQHSGRLVEVKTTWSVLEGYAMIRASHLAKGLDSDVSCQLCLNTHGQAAVYGAAKTEKKQFL